MMLNRIKITEDRYIGPDDPCFVIAEAGSNHNNDFETAKKLIDVAVDAGADAVKFQIYSAETLYSKKTPRHSNYEKDLWELIKEIETPREWIPKLHEYAESKGIIFFATPFDIEAVDQLDPYVSVFKIASFEVIDLELIEYVAKKGKPVIISTGLADFAEIQEAYQTMINAGNPNVMFLQCASSYPAPPKIMNLNAIETIRNSFNVITGLSDHSLGTHIPIASISLGAKIIEKHYTLDRDSDGPDHKFAIEPDELEYMVQSIRDVEAALGDGRKLGPSEEEKEYYDIARVSIHAKTEIKNGTVLDKDMLIIKRPGLGIKPKYLDMLIGKTVKEDIEEDAWITWDMVL